jgi:3-hydroxyacyl-CoA dehydrogenase
MAPGTFEPKATCVHDRLVEAGHLGQKSGAGFYRYDAETRARSPHPVADEFIEDARKGAGFAPRVISSEEITARTILALISEGCWILEEEIAERMSDIDVVYVCGYGFPRRRGGPMFYGESVGWANVLKQIQEYGEGPFGKWWKPAPYLEKLAQGAD